MINKCHYAIKILILVKHVVLVCNLQTTDRVKMMVFSSWLLPNSHVCSCVCFWAEQSQNAYSNFHYGEHIDTWIYF